MAVTKMRLISHMEGIHQKQLYLKISRQYMFTCRSFTQQISRQWSKRLPGCKRKQQFLRIRIRTITHGRSVCGIPTWDLIMLLTRLNSQTNILILATGDMSQLILGLVKIRSPFRSKQDLQIIHHPLQQWNGTHVQQGRSGIHLICMITQSTSNNLKSPCPH